MSLVVQAVLVGCVGVLLFVLGVNYGSTAFEAGVLLVCATGVGVLVHLGRDSSRDDQR